MYMYRGACVSVLQIGLQSASCICQHLLHGQDTSISKFSSGVKQVWIRFYFSRIGCISKAKETSLPNYLSIAAEEQSRRIHDFLKGTLEMLVV